MTMLVPTTPNAVTEMVSAVRRSVQERTVLLREMPIIPVLFVVKTGGGVGADFLVSMLDNWMTDAMSRPYVIQVGGVAGHVVRTHPAELFKRLHVDTPDIDAKLIDHVYSALSAQPAVVMIEASFMHRLPDILDTVRGAGLMLPIISIVLIRSQDEWPKILPILRNFGPGIRAMLTPAFSEDRPGDLALIPRLSLAEAALMASTPIDFRTLLARQTIGSAATLVKRVNALHQILEKIYVHQ